MFIEEYFGMVKVGLAKTCVTDGNGTEIDIQKACEMIIDKADAVKKEKGLIFFCGNGASATMAEHMSHDWFQNAEINTTTVSETSHITAISNDCSYDDVFSFRIKRILSERDILVTVSSSGNSPNIINAIKAARENGAYIVTFSGMKADNTSRRLGDLNFYVPLDAYGLVESAHAVLLHGVLDMYLDRYMGGMH